jgi:spore maturation protein CgeB
MKILLVGKFYSEGFALHILDALRNLGHEIMCYETGFISNHLKKNGLTRTLNKIHGMLFQFSNDIPFVRNIRARTLFGILKVNSFDLTIVCHDLLWPSEIETIKLQTKRPVVMWCPDAMVNFGKSYFLVSPYDALFFKDPYVVNKFSRFTTTPIYYLPECFNPQKHRPLSERSDLDRKKYSCEITTAGNLHAYRSLILGQLLDYDIKVWGPKPPLWLSNDGLKRVHQGSSVLNEEKAHAFLEAKIVINNLHYGEIAGVNVRAFEAAGIGAFQLVDWSPGIDDLFKVGEEIITFSNLQDLRKKINYWLDEPIKRQEIAMAAQRRALSEHTYEHRLALLIKTIKGEASGYKMPLLLDNEI